MDNIDNLLLYCSAKTIARILFDIECRENIPWVERSIIYVQPFNFAGSLPMEEYQVFISELDRLRRE